MTLQSHVQQSSGVRFPVSNPVVPGLRSAMQWSAIQWGQVSGQLSSGARFPVSNLVESGFPSAIQWCQVSGQQSSGTRFPVSNQMGPGFWSAIQWSQVSSQQSSEVRFPVSNPVGPGFQSAIQWSQVSGQQSSGASFQFSNPVGPGFLSAIQWGQASGQQSRGARFPVCSFLLFAWAFAVRLCNKYPYHMGQLSYESKFTGRKQKIDRKNNTKVEKKFWQLTSDFAFPTESHAFANPEKQNYKILWRLPAQGKTNTRIQIGKYCASIKSRDIIHFFAQIPIFFKTSIQYVKMEN